MRLLKIVLMGLIFPLAAASCSNQTPPTSSKQANAFSITLFQQTKSPVNQIISPYSAYNVFALVYPAAGGKTKRQIQQLFHYPNNLASLAALNQQLQTNSYDNTLHMNYSVWAQEGITFKSDYEESVESVFNAGLYHVNFNQPKDAVKKINSWVSDKTEGMIQRFLSAGQVAGAKSVLVNTLYFHGKWEYVFHKKETKEKPFFVTAAHSQQVPMMWQLQNLDYSETKQAQIVRLPYEKNRYSMLIILPKPGISLAIIRASLSNSKINAWRAKVQSKLVDLLLPRFDISNRIKLKLSLQKMGLTLPFSDKADFSNFSNDPNDMRISNVFQMAHIVVNEEGTKAAAATMTGLSEAVAPIEPIEMNANHPFLFILYANQSKTILFMGQVVEP